MQGKATLLSLTGLLGLALSACGGGSSGDLSGTGDRQYKSGPVTGFSSVIVDGERFTTVGTQFTIDERAGSEEELEVGMIVNLELGADGVLLSLEYDDNLSGPVEAVGEDVLIVAGHTVQIDELTNFAHLDPESLAVGDSVEVSGHETAAGQWLASFIGAAEANEAVELQGRVADLDTAGQSFRLGPVTVRYGEAGEFHVEGGLANGLLVEVAGSYDGGDRVLQAQRVERLQRVPPAEPGEGLEIAGLVRSPQAERFLLDQLTVLFDGDTRFVRGDSGDLQTDAPVSVAGELNGAGELVADVVVLRPRVNVEFEGEVESVDAEAGRITLLDGQQVELADDARVNDASAQGRRRFDLEDLQPGDRVLVVGFQTNGLTVALRLQRRDADTDGDGRPDNSRIRGSIGSLDEAQRSFMLEGVTVRISDATAFEGYADEADFFDRARPGDEASAEGDYDAGSRELAAGLVREE